MEEEVLKDTIGVKMKEEDVKSLVKKIPGVLSCKVMMGADNKIDEMHVLCANVKNTKQIVRDIQSAVNAKFDTDIDYKVISVAQIDADSFKEGRLKISGITITNMDNTIKAAVVLEYDDNTYEGFNIKVKSLSNKYKAVAEATISAIESFINKKDIFYLEGVEKKKIVTDEVILSLIGCTYKSNNNLFCGCCLVKGDENEAIAKSVLGAINRTVGTIV